MDILHSPIWIMIAKLLLAAIMIGFSLLCIFIVLKARLWKESLAVIEAECNEARDMAMLQGTMLRSQLFEVQERLKKKPEKAEIEVVSNLVRQAVPLLNLLVRRETSIFKWGFAGVKLVQSAFDYFSQKSKN